MSQKENNPLDYLKKVISEQERVEMKKAFKQAREVYLELMDAGFTMFEAFAFMAALTRQPPEGDENDE